MSTDDVDQARRRFEDTLQALRGRRLTTVDYWDVHNYGPDPADWDYGDWHHAVMGVELGTDRGPVTVTWTATFYPYGVEVLDQPIGYRPDPGDDDPQRVGPDDAGMRSWAPCLRSPIRAATCTWEHLRIGPTIRVDGSVARPAHGFDVPIAVRLDFDDTSVWFVAGMPEFDSPKAFIPADEIMVVFTRKKMLDLGFTTASIAR